MITSVVTNMVVCLAITTTHSFPSAPMRLAVVPTYTQCVETVYVPISDEERDPSPKGSNGRRRGLAWNVCEGDAGLRWAYGSYSETPRVVPLYLFSATCFCEMRDFCNGNRRFSKQPVGWIDMDRYRKEQLELLSEYGEQEGDAKNASHH